MASKERVVSTNEREFITSALQQDVRVDGRRPDTSRKVVISFGATSGEVEVSVGSTRVLASVSAELNEPRPDRPTEGLLTFAVDFSPIASPYYEAGRQTTKNAETTRVLERCIKDSAAVDLETLCVVAGQKVWSLKVDIRVCNNEGNVMDACQLAAIAALSCFRRPDVTVIGTTVTVHAVEDRHPVPLAMHHTPIATTFAFFDDVKTSVVDPSLSEELVASSFLTVAMNANKEVCVLHKAGGCVISKSTLMQCLKTAAKRTEALASYLKGCLDEMAAKAAVDDKRAAALE